MPTTLATSLEDLRSRLNESSAAFYLDSDLTNWINEGCREVARKALCLWETASINVFSGVQQYSAPTNMVKIHLAEFAPSSSINTYTLELRNYAEMQSIWNVQRQISQYTAQYMALWNSPPNLYFVLWPIPSQGGILTVYYYRQATPVVNSTDTLDVPEGWQDLPVLYSEYIATRKAGDQKWKDAKAIYEEKLQDMISTVGWHDAVGQMSFQSAQFPSFPYAGFQGDGGFF